jgi:hypothetical protein
MALTMQVQGIEELSRMLQDLEGQAPEIAAKALYEGAGIMADAYTQAAGEIKAEKFRYAFNGRKRLPSFEEKAAILWKSGVAKFQKNGSEVNTSVGVSGKLGYAEINGHKVAVRKLIYAINSGTSFMTKQPVFRRAATKAGPAASAAIISKAEEEINKLTK